MSGRKRDFSEELFGYFDGELAGDNFDIDSEADGFLDGVRKYFPHYGSEIEAEVNSIEAHIRTVSEKNRAARKELWRRYGSVCDIEAACAGRTRSVTEALIQYKSIVEMMRDAVREVKGSTPIDAAALREKLALAVTALHNKRYAAEIRQAEALKRELGKFVNADGSCNWDAIEEAMAKDPSAVTETEVMALSLVYLNLEAPEDINRFIFLGYGGGVPQILMTDDGTDRVHYPDAQMTDLFRRIASISEGIAAVTAQVCLTQNGELSEAARRMLRNAQMASYAAAYAPSGSWMVVTYPDGSVVMETGPCMAYTDAEGNTKFHDGEGLDVQFSYAPEYVDIDDLNDLANAYAEENRVNGEDMFWSAVGDVVLSTAIAAAMTLTLPEVIAGSTALAALGGLGAGMMIDTIRSTLTEFTGQYERNTPLNTFVRTSANLTAYSLLGAEVYVVKGPGSQWDVFGADFNTVENAVRTYGFISSDAAEGYGLSKSELESLIFNGDPEHAGWTPLAGSRLTEEEQRTIYEQYEKYVGDGGDSDKYRDSLNVALTVDDCPVAKVTVSECTPEEIKELVAFCDEHPEAMEGNKNDQN